MKTHSCLLVVAIALLGCQQAPSPWPKPPQPDADAAPLPPEPCEAAYSHLVGDGCEPPKPASGSWLDVCHNARNHGDTFGVRCILDAASPDGFALCGVHCGAP